MDIRQDTIKLIEAQLHQMKSGSKPTFIDLFAGCGGLSLGLLSSGWKGLFAVERDAHAFSTLKANLIDGMKCPQIDWPNGVPAERMPISKFLRLLRESRKLYDHLRGVDLVAGGPPCQGFSFAGRRRHDDPRNALFRDYLKVVALLRPKMLLIENVNGITVRHGKKKVPYAKKIKRNLNRLGYETFAEVHRASEFGVPQERPRYIVIGINRTQLKGVGVPDLGAIIQRAISAARITLLKNKGLDGPKVVTAKDALSDLEVAKYALEPCPDAPRRMQIKYESPKKLTAYQECLRRSAPRSMNSMRLARHSSHVEEKFKALIKACKSKNRRGVTLNNEERKPLKTKKRNVVVLDPDKPSHTLTTLPDDLLHYEEHRILTVREYARLQSFPDWFMFCGKYTTGGEMRKKECPRYTQVGNAVAPFVAEALGIALGSLRKVLLNVHADVR